MTNAAANFWEGDPRTPKPEFYWANFLNFREGENPKTPQSKFGKVQVGPKVCPPYIPAVTFREGANPRTPARPKEGENLRTPTLYTHTSWEGGKLKDPPGSSQSRERDNPRTLRHHCHQIRASVPLPKNKGKFCLFWIFCFTLLLFFPHWNDSGSRIQKLDHIFHRPYSSTTALGKIPR